MRKLIILFLIFFPMLCFSCSKENDEINSTIKISDVYVDITLKKGTEENIADIENIYNYYNKLFDNENEYEGLINIASINNATDYIQVSTELENIIKYSLNLMDELGNCFNPLGKKLNDIWKDACNSNVMPSNNEIEEMLKEIKESSLSISDNNIKILGNAKLDLDMFAKSYANQKVKEYLEENNITDYILNYYSRSITLGNSKDGYDISLYGIKNGYYNLNNLSISTVGNDLESVTFENIKYTTTINYQTGYSNSNYDKLFVVGEDALLNDILAYVAYNKSIDEIIELENKYNVSFLVYKDLELVYMGTSFENSLIK